MALEYNNEDDIEAAKAPKIFERIAIIAVILFILSLLLLIMQPQLGLSKGSARCTLDSDLCVLTLCEHNEDCRTTSTKKVCGEYGLCQNGSCAPSCEPINVVPTKSMPCPDGACGAGETCNTCPQDCGECPDVCGDNKCDASENCSSCQQDCGQCPLECPGGVCDSSENPPPVAGCGDDICNANETCTSCPKDCGECPCDSAEECPDAKTGVIIPLYTYPTDSTWETVISEHKKHLDVPMIVIVNPNNGVGESSDPSYVSGVNELKKAGITTVGYTYTSWTHKPMADLKAEIINWREWYDVDGIFFDEMNTSSKTQNRDYYKDLSSYTKSHGMDLAIGGPGTDIPRGLLCTMDSFVIYENPGMPDSRYLDGWHSRYCKSTFIVIAYNVQKSNYAAYLAMAKPYVGYFWETEDSGANPYDTLPTYFSQLLASLD